MKTVPIQDFKFVKDEKGQQVKDENGQPKKVFSPPNREVVLKPGINKVSESDWAKMRELRTIQGYIEQEDLVEMDSQEPSQLKDKKAVELIKDTFDPVLLLKWRADEVATQGRESVMSALDKQLSNSRVTEEDRKRARAQNSKQE